MAIFSSQGTLTVANASPLAPRLSTVTASGPFFDGYRRSYASIYRSQPNVRTVVDFFARNIAQLGLHAFRRLDDTDRQRITNHPLPRLIKRPNYATTRYRFIESTVQDIATYANAYWWKVRGRTLNLVRLPAGEVSVTGALLPTGYIWRPANGIDPMPLDTADVVHFRLFDPANPVLGYPPLETLRTTLAEEAAAAAYRRSFWMNGARFETVISRPKDAPKWEPNDRQKFRKDWQEFSGTGRRAGMTPILEDGMTIQNVSQNFRDAEASAFRKLTREEVAAAYHVPLPMVGILEHATFSNIKEQHKQLYQDCLGPWLTMLEEEIELQLLPEFPDLDEHVYVEFNIAEKMKGAFEEQATALQAAVGRPYMTANEARARINLPKHANPTADDLANTSPGQGQAFGTAGGDNGAPDQAANAAALRTALTAFVPRQLARLQKQAPEDRVAQFDHVRWSRELADDIRQAGGTAFTSTWGEDADRIAALINSETWARLEDGHVAWPQGRLESTVERFAEVLGA